MQLASSSKIFNIGSNNVVQYLNGTSKSNVVVQLPNVSFHEKNIVEVFLSVNHAEIPNSFYLINETNNTLNINATSYQIPPGNYNAITLLNTIQSGILSTLNISGTYNNITNKFTFTSGAFFTLLSTSTCQQFIGLEKIDYLESTLTSTFPLNFLPISRILFHSNALGVSNYNSGDNSFDTFLSCQNSSTSGSRILYQNYNALKYDITGLKHLNLIDIKVTDDNGNLINFLNADWTITLRLEYIYFMNPTSNFTFNQLVNNVSQQHIEKQKKETQSF